MAVWNRLGCGMMRCLVSYPLVLEGVKEEDLSPDKWEDVIRSHMFLKEKQVPEYKLKSRFVGGGNGQDKSLYEEKEISSPTGRCLPCTCLL